MLLVTCVIQIILKLITYMKGCFNEIVTKQILLEVSNKVGLR